MRAILLTLIFSLCFSAYGWEKKMSLRGGLGISQATIHAFDSSEDHLTSYGLNTHFGYRFKEWEINLSSYIHWGKIDDLRFRANNTSVVGSGTLSNASFGPTFKRIFSKTPFKPWHFYLSLGPTYSIQTVKLQNFQLNSGNFSSKYKLTYISRGGLIAIGIEEILPFKKMHPVYLEILYSYQISKKVSVVDASDFTEVETISTEESEQHIRSSYIMINAGITLF